MNEICAKGTFNCPICGKDTPHYHSPEEVTQHLNTENWVNECWEDFKNKMTEKEILCSFNPNIKLENDANVNG